MIPVNINATNYLGFIQKTGTFTNVTVQNVVINVSSPGTLVSGSGWVCQNITQYITVLNCSSNGNIPSEGGGIVGTYSSNITCTNCNSSGIISFNAGGILGSSINRGSAGANTIVTNCYSTGIAGSNSVGGIYGAFANRDTSSSSCQAIGCYSTMSTTAFNFCGGIYGADAGAGTSVVTCSATNCYSTGNIGKQCGGIFGSGAVRCTASYCYSIGTIGNGDFPSNAGGIFANLSVNSTATRCYSRGALSGSGNGGIFGPSSTSPTETDCYSANGSWTESTAATTLSLGSNPTIWLSVKNTVDNDSPYILDYYRTSWDNPFSPIGATNLTTFTTSRTTYNLAGFFPSPPSGLPAYPSSGLIYNYIFLKTTTFTAVPSIAGITGFFNGMNFNLNNEFYNSPVVIQNATPGESQPLLVSLNPYRNINTSTNNYLILDSDKITFDGQNIPFIVNVANYPGLLRKTGTFFSIIVQNTIVNTLSTGSLVANSGWIAGQTGWNGGSFLNCSTNGPISAGGGGIVGRNASNVVCNLCITSGSVGANAGGLFGADLVNNSASACLFSDPISGTESETTDIINCFGKSATAEGIPAYTLVFKP